MKALKKKKLMEYPLIINNKRKSKEIYTQKKENEKKIRREYNRFIDG